MNVLVVTTSNARFEGVNPHPTGVWLDEYTTPYMEFLGAGAELVVASPKGGPMPIDPRTLPTPAQEELWKPALAAAARTVRLAEVSADGFDAVFLPGGHGPMFDLPGDATLARLLSQFFAAGKLIAAVCHGPAGFLAALRPDGTPLVRGVTLTAYTSAEEVAAKLDKEVPFILEERLRALGANFIAREPKADHVERDGLFITGQNPNSSAGVARSAVAALRRQFPPPLNLVTPDLVTARTVAEFPPGTFLENIAVAPDGNIYVTSLDEGKVYQILGDGRTRPHAEVPRAAGLAFSGADLLVGSSVGSPAPGIYRVPAGGGPGTLVVPMPDAVFLNGMTHLTGDRYLVADSYLGRIWEVDVGRREYRVWLDHPALRHAADPFHPVQEFPGVNGLKVFGDAVFASSTQQQKIVRVPVLAGGGAGAAEVWMTGVNLDDFAFDAAGNLYGTTHVYDSVVRISPDRRVTVIAGAAQGVTGSTAAAFGRTSADATALYVTTNGGMSHPPAGGVQPGRVVRLEVGAPGYFRDGRED